MFWIVLAAFVGYLAGLAVGIWCVTGIEYRKLWRKP